MYMYIMPDLVHFPVRVLACIYAQDDFLDFQYKYQVCTLEHPRKLRVRQMR